MKTIAKFTLKLIKNIGITASIFFYCFTLNASEINATSIKATMKNPHGEIVTLRFALTKSEHTRGLSGLRPKDLKMTEGMLFVNKEMGPRKFWMPDTYFDLDIIFLDQDLKIVGIEKNVKFHPGMIEPPPIKRTDVYIAQFILETHSGSKFSKKLKVGDILKYNGTNLLSEIISSIRPEQ